MARRRTDRGFGEAFSVDPKRRRRRSAGRLAGRVIGWSLLVLVLALLLPYLLILLYRWEAVHPVSTLMIAKAASGEGYEREWVEFDDIAPVLVQSVMMSEDGRFCAHDGVDWEALNAVIDDAMAGERTRGASTIAMQTMKNLFLWQSRSFLRKGLEIPLAVAGDYVWPKRRMMEIYLNVAQWGPRQFGVGAAARHHFGVSADALSPAQAALLAVTLPNPEARNPASPTDGLRRLAGTVEARARQSGAYINCLYD